MFVLADDRFYQIDGFREDFLNLRQPESKIDPGSHIIMKIMYNIRFLPSLVPIEPVLCEQWIEILKANGCSRH